MRNEKREHRFPDFEIGQWSLVRLRLEKPVLLVAWRIEYPICRMTIPFFNRIANRYPGVHVLGICQESSSVAKEYCQANNIAFPQAADEDLKLTRTLGLALVPTYWLVGQDGTILMEGASWDKNKINLIADKIAEMVHQSLIPLITPSDNMPDFRPG